MNPTNSYKTSPPPSESSTKPPECSINRSESSTNPPDSAINTSEDDLEQDKNIHGKNPLEFSIFCLMILKMCKSRGIHNESYGILIFNVMRSLKSHRFCFSES